MIQTLTKRPIGVLATVLLVLITGWITGNHLPVSLMPAEPRPELVVDIDWQGQPPSVSEDRIIAPLRRSLRELPDLRSMKTFCSEHQGMIRITFDWGADLVNLSLLANEAIDRVRSQLPRHTKRPTLRPPGISDLPVASIIVTSSVLSLPDLSDWATYTGARRFEQLPSIAHCDIQGEAATGMYLQPDKKALQAVNLTLQDLKQQLATQIGMEVGFLSGEGIYEIPVLIHSRVRHPESLLEWPVRIDENQQIPLGQLASLDLSVLPPHQHVVHHDRHGILLHLYEQKGANLLQLQTELAGTFAELQASHPDLSFHLLDHQANWVIWSLAGLAESAMYGAGFAILLLFLVMRSWRAPLLMAITVPGALLLSAIGFYLLDLSLNLMSIAGLALGTGILIDNGIIVVENIQRCRLNGLPQGYAVVKGTRDMVGPLLASSATTMCMFVPLWLADGMAGVLFQDLALAVGISLSASLIVALGFLPVLDKQLPLGKNREDIAKAHHRGSGPKNLPLKPKLPKSFRLIGPWLSLGALLMTLGLGWKYLPVDVFPPLNLNDTTLDIRWEPGTSIQSNRERTKRLREDILAEFTPVTSLIGAIDYGRHVPLQEAARLRFHMTPSRRDSLSMQLTGWFSLHAPEAVWQLSQPENALSQWIGKEASTMDLRLVPLQPGQMDSFREDQVFIQVLAADPAVKRVQLPWSSVSNSVLLTPRLRDAGHLGINWYELAEELRLQTGKTRIHEWQQGDETLRLLFEGEDVRWHKWLHQSSFKGIPLTDLVSWQMTPRPNFRVGDEAHSFHILRIWTDRASISPSTLSRWQDLALEAGWMLLPDPHAGEAERQQRNLFLLFGLGLLLLMVVLIAQFESLWYPVVVLSTIPFGLGGSVLLLLLTGSSLNLMSGMGMIIVSGIVVNDAILKVEAIRRHVQAGKPPAEATRMAGKQRLRAIVLTSATTILAMVPVLFAEGVGGDLQSPLAISVIGGMLAGTAAAMWWVKWLVGWMAERNEKVTSVPS